LEATVMSTLNSIPFTAAGNLTADPELRFTGTGKPVTGVRIVFEDQLALLCAQRRRSAQPVVIS
jgi:hypothetical protein